jgi:hypothetical protein
METIRHESGNPEAWVCICGNTPTSDGFYPCDKFGKEVVPDMSWIDPIYVCHRCGRIIHANTLQVVGMAIVK